MFTCGSAPGVTLSVEVALPYELVIADVHARVEALRALLEHVGAVDARGRRRRGWWIVQVGDLLDRRASAADNLATARLATESLDVALVGNHEWRLLTEPGDHGAALATLAAHGWPHAAAACGDWLVTHAGVHPDLADGLSANAADSADEINHRWQRTRHRRARDPLFAWVGPARGGPDPCGGIIWMHSDEWPADRVTPWGQIAGHVPQRQPRMLPGPRWAIDTGARNGRLAAVVRRRGDEIWRPLVVKAQSGASRSERRRLAAIAA
jgi:hypothetical protein